MTSIRVCRGVSVLGVYRRSRARLQAVRDGEEQMKRDLIENRRERDEQMRLAKEVPS